MTVIAFYSDSLPHYHEVMQAAFARHDDTIRVLPWAEALATPEQVDYVLVWSPPPGDLARFPNLRGILSLAAGVDHITRNDPDWPMHVPLVRMGGDETARLMGDYVLWACLGLLRGAPQWLEQQRAHVWQRRIVTRPVSTLKIGVMGLGQLGRYVATHLAHATGATVRGWARSMHDIAAVTTFAGPEQLATFCTGLDVLVCLLPDTPATMGLINAEVLAMLRPGAGVVNVGRSGHVVLPDLLAALDGGHLSGAVMDVFDTEPLPADSPLWDQPGLIITPHVASQASVESRVCYLMDVLRTIAAGGRPPLTYDPERGY